MNRLTRRSLLYLLAAALLAHVLILLPLPYPLQATAALILAGFVPGALLVELLVGRSASPPTLWERILYSIAAGYAIMVAIMLLISYLPGGVTSAQTILGFDAVIVVLAALAWRRIGRDANPEGELLEDGVAQADRAWLIAGIVSLLLIGAFFRFPNLGYAEYQGDEARAALRAAAVIQGYEDVLLIHKKGPTEILLPTVIYAMTGHLTEATARLPFAIASLAGLFAVFLLGWRLFGPVAGWTAALLLALDGYFIGFARIVQYQSIVFLTSALVVLVLYRLYRQPRALTPYLTLASIFLATGLLSHYEAAQVVVPAFFLAAAIGWQRKASWSRLLIAVAVASGVGLALMATFYIPFVLHPHFGATYTYLIDRRIGGSFPYNNLADFALRTTIYSTTYQFALVTALTLVALTLAYRQGLGRAWGTLLGIGVAVVVGLTTWRADWLTLGATDYLFAPVVLAIVLVCILPRISVEERMLWLWFGAPMLFAFFFTEKPRTHVYIFFTPWLLLVGSVLDRGWRSAANRFGRRSAAIAGIAAAGIAVVVFGFYAYLFFVHNRVEVLRTWRENRPAGYWVAYDEPDEKAIFGFPLANGWKVVGALYDQGVIDGNYETNEKEAWVPSWYTRGEQRCGRSATWFFEIDNLESWGESDQKAMEHFLRQGFTKWAKVEINGAPRMVIYKRTGEQLELPTAQPIDDLPTYRLSEVKGAFDALATPDLPLTYPSVESAIPHPLAANFDNQIWLEGYDIAYEEPLAPGDTIHLTLFWRGQKPIAESYKVFNQSYFGDGAMIAQQDGYPVCETRETWRWDPGELITDEYELRVNDDAPDGLYPLYTGFYLEQSFDRLPVLDEIGAPIDTQVHLSDIRIGEE